MKVIICLSKNRIIMQFIPYFEEAFSNLGINYRIILVDENKDFVSQRENLKKILENFKADKLLIVNDLIHNGEYFINQDVLKLVKVYVWFVDTMKNNEIINDKLEYYSGLFSFEADDVEYCKKKYGLDLKYAVWPTCKSIFCTKDLQNYSQVVADKKYDIGFVGLVAGCEKRLKVLNVLAEYCSVNNRKLALFGHYWHNSNFWQRFMGRIKFKLKYPILYRYVHNEYLSPEQSAQLYSDSKININIHVQHHNGFNIRTFDILGNGNFELCDIRETNKTKLIDGKHLVLYSDEVDLINKVEYYLNHPEQRAKIGVAGAKLVREEYSFDKAVKFVLVDN